jgi:ABC-type branched-subunit amino acid transport system substrate-binding protein
MMLLAHPLFAATLGPVPNPIGAVRIPKGVPIQIAANRVLSRADAAMGIASERGAELVFRTIANKLLDRLVKDDQCNAEGSQTVAPKLVANPQLLIVLSGVCSLTAAPAVPIYPSFTDKYRKAYREAPIPAFYAKDCDTTEMAVRALPKATKDDHDGNLYVGRQALRNTIFTEKFDGLSGPVVCDASGKCAKFKPTAYEFVSSETKTLSTGKGQKEV